MEKLYYAFMQPLKQLSTTILFLAMYPFMLFCQPIINNMEEDFTATTETHCLGRFLIDVPQGTQLRISYMVANATVNSFSGITRTEFERMVAASEKVLQDSVHRLQEMMFMERDDISANHVTLVSWATPYSDRGYHYDVFFYLPADSAVFHFVTKGNSDPESRKKAIDVQKKYAEQLRYRNPMEIPDEPGFCICKGLIGGTTINREEMTVGFFFPTHPHVKMSLTTFVTRDNMSPGARPSSLFMRLKGIKVLRNRTRIRAGRKAQEILLKYKDKDTGRWFYEFELKAASKGSSVAYPYITVTLQAGSYEYDDDGSSITSAFFNDKEALELWDLVVGSLRLNRG